MISESLAETEQMQEQIPILDEEAAYRAGTWGLLAVLLRDVPDRETLERVAGFSGLEGKGSDLQAALAMLGLAASSVSMQAVDDEFHDLFIGMGRGELLPYGSWYQTGFLMERPLSLLREELAELGYQRDEGVHEPEDHVAALCEVMALLIQEGRESGVQAAFFRNHMEGWLPSFFRDLGQARSAVFYRSVGRLGEAFVEFERQYLSMQ